MQVFDTDTIRNAQIVMLRDILDHGKHVEDTLELNNISGLIEIPLQETDELYDTITKTGKKFHNQMLLKQDTKLEKTHFNRLHVFLSNEREYDQYNEVLEKLKEKSESRRGIITMWRPEDVNDPYALCWTFSQFMIRDKKLIMTSYFRSCDIWNAFPFNMLGLANLQKRMSDDLGVVTGEFIVHIGSAHFYKKNVNEILEFFGYIEDNL